MHQKKEKGFMVRENGKDTTIFPSSPPTADLSGVKFALDHFRGEAAIDVGAPNSSADIKA